MRGNKELVEKLYPVGTKIELVHMEDTHPVPSGTKGVVSFIDDIGPLHIDWENGSSLALVYGVDKFNVI